MSTLPPREILAAKYCHLSPSNSAWQLRNKWITSFNAKLATAEEHSHKIVDNIIQRRYRVESLKKSTLVRAKLVTNDYSFPSMAVTWQRGSRQLSKHTFPNLHDGRKIVLELIDEWNWVVFLIANLNRIYNSVNFKSVLS